MLCGPLLPPDGAPDPLVEGVAALPRPPGLVAEVGLQHARPAPALSPAPAPAICGVAPATLPAEHRNGDKYYQYVPQMELLLWNCSQKDTRSPSSGAPPAASM